MPMHDPRCTHPDLYSTSDLSYLVSTETISPVNIDGTKPRRGFNVICDSYLGLPAPEVVYG